MAKRPRRNHQPQFKAKVALDVLKGEVPAKEGLVEEARNFVAYCFYVPVAFSGPIINYKEFHDGVSSKCIICNGFRALRSLLLDGVGVPTLDAREDPVSWPDAREVPIVAGAHPRGPALLLLQCD